MLDLLNRYTHGFVAVPVVLNCQTHGFFELLQQHSPLTATEIAQQLSANSGHLNVALRLMHSLRWLELDDAGRYSLTPAADIRRHIPLDILTLYHRPIEADLTNTAPDNPLLSWLQQAQQNWQLDGSPLMADFLDGVLLIPILLALKTKSLLPQDESTPLFSKLAPAVADALSQLLLGKGWLQTTEGQLNLTGLGQFMFDRALIAGTTASYTPMLARMDEVLFGDCQAVFSRDAAGHEQHLDRTLNVISSGFQHGKFFADVDNIILSIFNRQPFEAQPKYIADMGCGDGSFLKRVYQLIHKESARGQALDDHPLTMIGVDYNQKALDATTQNLADIPHLVMPGDIGDPEALLADLQAQGIDPNDVLHIRSFLDHDRPFIPPTNETGVQNRADQPYHGVYVAPDGQAIPAPVAVQSLVEHLQRWSKVAVNHGLILLEVHNLPPDIIYQYLDRSENLHFDAYHAFSGQLLVESDLFLMSAAEAGLFPRPGFAQRYPKTFPFCRITLNWFEQRPYTIRYARPDDIAALLALEDACWAKPLRTPAEQILRRIEQLPNGQCVVEMDGQLVGVIYSHLITDAAVLENITHTQIPALHNPQGNILQLLAVNVLPNISYFGLGDELVEFMLTLAARKNGIERVVGITHSTSYKPNAAISKEEHIRQRNPRGLLVDPILRFHEAHGATIKNLIPGFRPPEDDHLGLWILIDYDIFNRQPGRPQSQAAPPQSSTPPAPDNLDTVEAAGQIDILPIIEQSIKMIMGPQRQITFEPTQPLMEMGLDSLELLEFSDRLSQELDVALDPSFFFQYSTPQAIADYFKGEISADNARLQSLLTGAARAAQPQQPGQPTATAAKSTSDEPIAIVGLACRFPGGDTPQQFWEMLQAGQDAVAPLSSRRQAQTGSDRPWPGGFLEQVDRFDAAFFKIPPREAKFLDPQQRLLLETHWEALERAGINPQTLAGSNTGIFVGLFSHDYELLQSRSQTQRGAYFSSGNSASMAAGRISYFFDFQGPSLTIDTACSSSLVALHQAVAGLQRGECNLALASGVNLVLAPDLSQSFTEAGMLAPDGRCKTFDDNANGFGRSEGCGVVVLKPLSHALADGDNILAVVRGSAVNQNGASNGLGAPNGLAQEAVVRQALAVAGLMPQQVSYVETHGTGTPLGDAVELKALENVYKAGRSPEFPLILGAVKTNIGHTEAASGIAGLIKVILSMQHRQIPPNLNFNTLSSHLSPEKIPAVIPTAAMAWTPDADADSLFAGVSAFGFGGANAHVILESPPALPDPPAGAERTHHLLTLSAQSQPALRQLAQQYAQFMARSDSPPLPDICFTANNGRAAFKERLSVVGQTAADISEQLLAFANNREAGKIISGQGVATSPKIAFLFTGQGAQYVNMARDLYATSPTFCRIIDDINDKLTGQLIINNEPASLLDLLYPDDAASPSALNETAITQPALFAIEYALAKLWQSWGINPNFVLGHSVGEYVAACLAGVFSLEDGLKLIAARGRLMQALPQDGQMAVVFAQPTDIMPRLEPYPRLSVAAINGPQNIVISGHSESLAALLDDLRHEGIKSRKLAVSHAFHSPLMEPMLAEFAAVLNEVTLRPPRLNIVANVTGAPATDAIATPDYWLAQIRQPVRFAAGIENLQAYQVDVFIECGPQATLLGMGRQCLPDDHLTWLPSCQRGMADWSVLLQSLGRLASQGVVINWAAFEQDYPGRQKVTLPTYPFQRQPYWFDQPDETGQPAATAAAPGPAITWQQQPLHHNLPPDYLPAPTRVIKQMAPHLEQILGQAEIDTYASFLEQIESLSVGYILLALDKLGWQPQPGDRFSTESLAEQLGVVAQHHRVLGRYLQILAQEGILTPNTPAAEPLRPHAATWEVCQTPTIPPATDLLQQLYNLFHRYPQAESELNLFLRCAPKVGDVLQGKANPLHLIFPNGDLTTSVKLFRYSAAFGPFNVLAQKAMLAALAPLPAGRTLRILEVGGGTGGTTFNVLPGLSATQTEYVFTDISRLFTQKAEEEFKNFPFISYNTLDVEKDPEAQGYEPHSFDLILASNVLHATPSLRQTLGHVQQLLTPGGLLLLLEGSAPRRWTDVIFGLIDGWWRFADFERRPDYAFLTAEKWESFLKEIGFAQVASLSSDLSRSVFPQAVILAAAPSPATAAAPPRRWLILADSAGIGEQMAARLEAQGQHCVLAYQDSFSQQQLDQSWLLNPHTPTEAAQLLHAAQDDPFDAIVHLWLLDDNTAANSLAPFSQALLTRSPQAAFYLISRGQQPVTPQDSPTPGLDLAALKQTLGDAFPDAAITWLDLDPAPRPGDARTLLDAFQQSDDSGPEVAFRDGLRYEALTTPVSANDAAALRRQVAVAPPAKRRALLQTEVQTEVARILHLDEAGTVPLNRGFFELGITSLTSVELAAGLQKNLGYTLPPTLAFDYPNITALVDYLLAAEITLPLPETSPPQSSTQSAAAPVETAPSLLPTVSPAQEPTTSAHSEHLRQKIADLEARLEHQQQLHNEHSEPIAVIGVGCRFPGQVRTPTDFWQLLRTGQNAIRQVPPDRWDIDTYYDPTPGTPGKMYTRYGGFVDGWPNFDPYFFGISPREATSIDPQHRLLLEVSWEGLEHSGIDPQTLVNSQTGVFVGIAANDYGHYLLQQQNDQIDAYTAAGHFHSMASGRLSYTLGLQGPSISVDTACSSSLVSVHLACQSLRNSECTLALAGGVNHILTPKISINYAQARMLAADGRCKTFDAAADGFVRAEGAGMIVLKRLSVALADGDNILAVIRGSAVNQDGPSSGLTVPNGPAQQAVIKQALASGQIEPHQVGYVEAHGTGTSLGDPIELGALGAVYGPNRDAPLLVGSVKTNLGHLEAAAGIAGLVKVILSLHHNQIPAHLHFNTPNPRVNWEALPITIPTRSTPWPTGPRLAGISAFGFSGTNAHMILEQAPAPITTTTEPPTKWPEPHLFTVSAKTETALTELATRHQTYLRENPGANLADVCYTAGAGRAHFEHRLAILADSTTDLLQKLEQSGGPAIWRESVTPGSAPKIAFLFTGQGAQYINMARDLYQTQPLFRQILDDINEQLLTLSHQQISLLDVLYPNNPANIQNPTSDIDQTAFAQPALFAIELALAKLWQAWGITPDVVMGHSVGEYAAACLAGVFSLEDGLKLIAARGRLMQSLPQNGQMLAVFASEAQVAPLLEPVAAQVSLAAINGPKSVVISGLTEAVAQVAERLKAQGIRSRPLNTSHAFHSPLMAPILADFERVARSVTYQPPQIEFISNVSGSPVTNEVTQPAYWVDHIRQPVRFAAGVAALQQLNVTVFVEIGPQPTLISLARRSVETAETTDKKLLWLPSLRRGQKDWEQMLTSLGQLYARGVTPNFAALNNHLPHRKVTLPTYPFQRRRYWLQETIPAAAGDAPAETPTPGVNGDSGPSRPLLADEKSNIPAPQTLRQQAAPLLAELNGQPDLAAYQAAFQTLERLSVGYILAALQNLGLTLTAGQSRPAAGLAEQLKVAPQHRHLFLRLLDILAQAGLIHHTPAANGGQSDTAVWQVSHTPPPYDIEALTNAAAPIAGAEFTLLTRCGPRLAQILRGDVNPLNLLFPDDVSQDDNRLSTVTQLYEESLPFTAINRLTQQVVKAVVTAIEANRPAAQPLHILEIGAGTGATTAYLLPHLPAQQTRYLFSDISPLFTRAAQERFKSYPFMAYSSLNIEQDPISQGLNAHQFDIIVASNVLHATQNLTQTLGHVRRLLAPGGLLILLEVTAPQRWLDLTFGLLDGWWRFNDAYLRPTYPLLRAGQWHTLLDSCGFESSTDLTFTGLDTAADIGPIVSQQAVLLAQAPQTLPDVTAQAVATRPQPDAPARSPAEQISLPEQLAQTPPDERLAVLQSFIRSEVAHILGWNSPDSIDMQQGFFNLGMDSLTSMELRSRLQSGLDCVLPPTLTFDYPTSEALVKFLQADVLADFFTAEAAPPAAETSSTSDDTPTEAPTDLSDMLSGSEAARLLAKKLGLNDDD